ARPLRAGDPRHPLTSGSIRRVRASSFRPAAALPLCLAIAFAIAVGRPAAATRTASADGQFWDIQDTSPWSQDSGGIATGGAAMPFNGFGYLKLQVRRPDRAALVEKRDLPHL